jgi:hypothetical protein
MRAALRGYARWFFRVAVGGQDMRLPLTGHCDQLLRRVSGLNLHSHLRQESSWLWPMSKDWATIW